MSEEFLTIKEAAAKTGKAEITIRRFVQRTVKGNDPHRRAFLKPSPEELQKHTDGPPPAWRISTKLLRQQFPSQEQGSVPASAGETASEDTRIVAVLTAQLAVMEQQLNVKDEQLKSLTTLVHSLGDQLNERLRESNVLMKGLQERLALPAQNQKVAIEAPLAEPIPKAINPKREGKRETPKSKPVRGGWMRLLFNGEKSTP